MSECVPDREIGTWVVACSSRWWLDAIHTPLLMAATYHDGGRFEPVAGCIGPCVDYGPGWRGYDWHLPIVDLPGVQREPSGEWYGYAHPDDEDAQGPMTEAEALDWLWRHPAGEWIEVCSAGPLASGAACAAGVRP